MQGIEILLISVLVAFAQGTNSSQFPNWQSSWIEGGSVAAAGEFPYLVSVRNIQRDHHMCGGSIISEWFILTTAHCIFRLPESSVIVVVGTNTLNTGGKKHKVSSIFTHPIFRQEIALKDIAMLRLINPVVYSPTAHSIKLPNYDERVDEGTVCNFGGWGITSEHGPLSNNLLKLQITTVSSTECEYYNAYFDDTGLCARAPPGKGPCRGDSGGPLVCGDRLVGIFSTGGVHDAVCKTGYPLEFVYVSKYINWIVKNSM